MARQRPDDQVPYPRKLVEGLIEGAFVAYSGAHITILPSVTWEELRSSVESTGDIESEACAEVMDLDRAVAALAQKDVQAAAVVWLRIGGFTYPEIDAVLSGKRAASRRVENSRAAAAVARAIRWITRYLCGVREDAA